MYIVEKMVYGGKGDPEGYTPISPLFETKSEAKECCEIFVKKYTERLNRELERNEIRVREVKPVKFITWLERFKKEGLWVVIFKVFKLPIVMVGNLKILKGG